MEPLNTVIAYINVAVAQVTVTSDHATRPFKLSASVCPEPTSYQEKKGPSPAPQKPSSGEQE